MTNVNLKVNGASISATLDGVLTSGMVGIPVTIEYDPSWGELTKTIVFRVGRFARDRENVGTATTVPWEVLRHPGKVLEVGIVGKAADGSIVFPTVWTSIGTMQGGAYTTVPGAPNPDNEDDHTGGAPVDDSQISNAYPWSSRNIVDKLCPAFTESGAVVTCEPVEGYPLKVVSQIAPVQAGSGHPGPDNIRPIAGHKSINLTHNDTTVTVSLGQTVYNGSYDWTTGLLTITQKLVVLTSDIGWIMSGDKNPNGIMSFYTKDVFDENARDGTLNFPNMSSHYRFYEVGWSINGVSYQQAIKTLSKRIYIADARFADLASFNAFLDDNEVQFSYWLGTPVTIQLTPRQILALSGTNTLTADTGSITVTGRADPVAINAKQEARLAALETALINT